MGMMMAVLRLGRCTPWPCTTPCRNLPVNAPAPPCVRRYFHGCDGCQLFCLYSNTNDFSRERCRLASLPDIAQEQPEIRDMLLEWLAWLQDNFQFDAFRVDAAGHLGKVGWLLAERLRTHPASLPANTEGTSQARPYPSLHLRPPQPPSPPLPSPQPFSQAMTNASKVFTIGEYYLNTPYDQVAEWLGDRLNSGALHSSLGIQMLVALREVFLKRSATMQLLPYVRKLWAQNFPNHVPVGARVPRRALLRVGAVTP